ncbi:MAG: helix-turn-helix domain-containing protein [Bacteroidaceae bacterium]
MIENSENPKVYSVNDLVEILQLNRKTITGYIRTGQIKAFRVGNGYRVTNSSLELFMSSREVKPTKK